MPWGQREELTKEKLQEMLGLDPVALKAQLDTMNTTLAEFNTIKTQLSEFQTVKDSLARIETSLTQRGNNNGGNNNGGNNNNNNQQEERPQFASILEDEDAAINGRIDARLGPIAEVAITTRAEMAYNSFRASKPDFHHFEKEIRERWDGLPANQKVNAQQLVSNLYYMFKGMKVDKDGNQVTFVEPGNTGGGQGTGPNDPRLSNQKKDAPLTDDEKARAAKWGVSEADYLKNKASMTFVGG